MRLIHKIVILFFVSVFTLPAIGGNPTGYLNFATFTTPGGKNYFETYLSVVGSSFRFVKDGKGGYVAQAHVTLSFKQGDSIITSANFNLLSPHVKDTLSKPDFIDVHRFWLPKGIYTLAFTIDDPNDASHKTNGGKQDIRVGYPADKVCISDAEFLSSYTPANDNQPYNKCGYDMTPYVFSDYLPSDNRLSFYCEVYNSNKFIPHQKFTLKYAIEEEGDYVTLYAGNYFSSSTALNADTVVPFMANVPLGNLPTGSYYLVVSVTDMNNHLLAVRKYNFTKENPSVKATRIPAGFAVYMATRDTLEESIRCLAPISHSDEKAYVISDSLDYISMPELKHFFYYFWQSRDSLHPLDAWQKYLSDVMKVNHSFSTRNVKGYKTDRGRVYLQYGPPNIRVVERSNPATYPHEIWEYYKLPDGETDTKFVFYSTAIETNNFDLLHSTATGEIHNPQWQSVLYSTIGNGLPSNLDDEKVQDQLGEDVNDEFNNPH